MMTETHQLVMLGLVVLLSGISKSGFAGALGIFSVPLLALVMLPQDALSIMLPVLIIGDVFSLNSFWRLWDRRELIRLIPGTLVGIVVAVIFLIGMSPSILTLLIAILSITFALKNLFLKNNQLIVLPAKPLAWICSLLAGVSTTLVHAGGPPLLIYLSSRKLGVQSYIATAAVIFALMNIIKLAAFSVSGILKFEHVWLALAFTPLAFIGNWIGVKLSGGFSQSLFLKYMNLLLIVLGIVLIAKTAFF
ncbi:sulfite exporter TauE/SafE family protein (plasmid) [Pseudoalteromonas sp. T1lg65]|uniref:sulfite exporter TauE/SafE family protein n=1 Tax=Pseudoalteromonas sp. T1lg65 TaxID=2077101 RepID=UPI003F79074B